MADFKEKMRSLESYFQENSDVDTGVNIDYAKGLDLQVHSDEADAKEFELFSQSKNTKLAFALLEA